MYTLLPKSTPNLGYIEEWDIIEYDFGNNWLQYRADRLGNEFRYSYETDFQYFHFGFSAIVFFQWGNGQCYDNKVTEGYISNLNSPGQIYSNVLGIQAAIYGNTMDATARINANVLNSGSGAAIFSNILGLYAYIDFNSLDGASSIWANTMAQASKFSNNVLTARSIVAFNTIGFAGNVQSNMFIGSLFQNQTISDYMAFNNNMVQISLMTPYTFTTSPQGFTFTSLPYFDNDAAAAGGGLVTGNLYQLTGALVTPPFNVRGIVMAKQ